MTDACKPFKVGTRGSPLARIQTRDALAAFTALLPAACFEVVAFTTPGDQDHATDLRDSPPDFFTRTLDDAVREGTVDLAVHSAKDLPDPVAEGLDWFWLPERGDRRDALVGSVSPRVIGVSSERRAAYARSRFPGADCRPVRGSIQERLQQLDDGAFDALIMAGVALQRLGLAERIAQWIPLEELDTPEAQGALAVTFRRGDARLQALRSLFVKSVAFAGAGVCEGHLTRDAMRALQTAEVCLYDALLDAAVLDFLPPEAVRLYVGKRQGAHSHPQEKTNQLLCDHARRGLRTVRLKGGDPGIFGRLAEEVEALAALGLASRVIPGVSAMQTVAATSGILLTRRGVARGFSVMTPRLDGGARGPVDAAARAALPVVFYMAIGTAVAMAAELMADGMPAGTPCALVFGAGTDGEAVFRTTLAELEETLQAIPDDVRSRPGLFIAGEIARYGGAPCLGPLGGRRVLLTCSEALMERAVQAVHDLGGRPVCRPLISLQPLPSAAAWLHQLETFDWIALTSPSAVRCFLALLLRERLDLRRLPDIMTCGPGTRLALQQAGLDCELMPAQAFSTEGLLAAAAGHVNGKRILRLRSHNAGEALAEGLRAAGAQVCDVVLYENRPVRHDDAPEFEAVFFASASAVESFAGQWGTQRLQGKLILAMGGPTRDALQARGLQADVTGNMAAVDTSLQALAAHLVRLPTVTDC